MAEYTGRVIGIIADPHALLEPTQAALEDMASQGITELYSLGDNIGEGPNPGEVLDLLKQYGVKSVAGNSEEYITMGTTTFHYLNPVRQASCLWTTSKLNEEQIGQIKLFPHTIELILGGKKLALVHFANDVRFDYHRNSTWSYQDRIERGKDGFKQFFWTNSEGQQELIDDKITEMLQCLSMIKGKYNYKYNYHGADDEIDKINYLVHMLLNETELDKKRNYFQQIKSLIDVVKVKLSQNINDPDSEMMYLIVQVEHGLPYLSSKVDPLLFGHTVDMYDAIIQGHVHFKIYESSESQKFYSVRSVGMAYKGDPIDAASYLILRETTDGYEVEERLVKFDREKMEAKILSCDIPDRDKIIRFTETYKKY